MKSISRFSCLILVMNLMMYSAGISSAAAAVSLSPENGALSGLEQNNKIDASAQSRAASAYAKLPLSFEVNQGQTDASVKFLARGRGYTLFLTASEAVLTLKTPAKAQGFDVVRMSLNGANSDPVVRGLDILPSYSSYMTGNDQSKWQTNVKQYSKVEYKQVYPGIDVVYYGNQGQLEYDFVVAPGANPGLIKMNFQGAKNLELDKQGNLLLNLKDGRLTFNAPMLYQKTGAARQTVAGRFVLASNNQVCFKVGIYDKNKELVIDPVLGYSSFLGGAGATEDKAYAIAVDNAGNAYVTGTTNSPDFPVGTPPPGGSPIQGAIGTGYDMFITKINPDGTLLVWSTYLGGATDETGLGIAVDGPSGRAYITGSIAGGANLPGSTPLTGMAGDLTGINAFVVGIAADGLSTTLNVTFGAQGDDIGNGIVIDSDENVYVTGSATAGSVVSDPFAPETATFPTTANASPSAGARGASQAFVMKFTKFGVQVYGTYLGGTGFAYGRAIAVDGLNGNAYVTGNTGSDFYTTVGAFKPTWGGGSGEGDAFIAKLNPAGTSFVYKTYVGGAGDEEGTGIAVDSINDVYITGYTGSAAFPDNTVAFLGIQGVGAGRATLAAGPFDAFVIKLRIDNGGGHADGVYATFLGGDAIDKATSIKVDSAFNVYVAGYTTSGTFPIVGANAAAGQATFIGTPEAFVTELDNTGGPLIFSTWLGGDSATYGQGLALDSLNNIYLTGYTGSTAETFPLVAGGFQQTRGTGTNTAFITKFGSGNTPLPVITGINPLGGALAGGTTVVIEGTGFTGVTGSTGVVFGNVNASTYTVNSSTQITAISPAHIAGIVDIVVANSAGSSFVVLADSYTYYNLPSSPSIIGNAISTSSIMWTWTDTNSGVNQEDGYRVKRAIDDFVLVNLAADTTYWTQTGLDVNSSTSVYVEAHNPAGNAASISASTYTFANPPTGTEITYVYYSSVTIHWSANSNPPDTRWGIQRSTSGNFTGPISAVVSYNSNLTTYTYIDTGLTDLTTYYYRVQAFNGDNIATVFGSIVSTITLPAPPQSSSGFNGTVLSTESISWSWNAAPEATYYKIYNVSDNSLVKTLQGDDFSTSWTETNLLPNARYSRYVVAGNISSPSGSSSIVSIYTLAYPPSQMTAATVSVSEIDLSWADSGASKYQIMFSTNGYPPEPAETAGTVESPAVTYRHSGLQAGTTYFYWMYPINGDGVPSASFNFPQASTVTLTPPEFRTTTPVDPNVSTATSVNLPSGDVTVNISANTFSQTVIMTVSSATAPASDRTSIKVTGICLEITAGGQQPQKDITITIHYNNSDIAGLVDESKQLTIGRYDPAHSRWLVLPSTVYPGENKIVCRTDHLSTFALLQLVSAADLSLIKVYPNPFNPKKVAGLIIENLTDAAEIKIYTVAGQLIRKVPYDTHTGRALWEGENDAGEPVASGVYIAYIKSSSGDKRVKIAVQR